MTRDRYSCRTSSYSRSAPSSLPRFLSNVPSGMCPALRAISRTRQSDKPRDGFPLRTNTSAGATCFGSSRVSKRTRRFVSTARIFLAHATADRLLQLFRAFRFRSIAKESMVDIFRGVPADSSDHDMIVFLFPLEDGTWSDPQLSPNLGGYRDLALRCELRLGP